MIINECKKSYLVTRKNTALKCLMWNRLNSVDTSCFIHNWWNFCFNSIGATVVLRYLCTKKSWVSCGNSQDSDKTSNSKVCVLLFLFCPKNVRYRQVNTVRIKIRLIRSVRACLLFRHCVRFTLFSFWTNQSGHWIVYFYQ